MKKRDFLLLSFLLQSLVLFLIANVSFSATEAPSLQSIYLPEEEVTRDKTSQWIEQTRLYNIFEVNPDALVDASGSPASVISIPMPEGNHLQAQFSELQQVDGSAIWMGSDSTNLQSDIALTQVGNSLVGSIHTAGKLYVLEPYGQHLTLVRNVHTSNRSGASEINENIRTLTKRQTEDSVDFSSAHQAGIPENATLRVLSLYSDEARIQSGGETAVIARLNIAIAQFNRALTKAGVSYQIEVAAHKRIPVEYRFLRTTTTDLDEEDVRILRDQYKADFVSILTSDDTPTVSNFFTRCGIPGNYMVRSQTLTEIRELSTYTINIGCLDLYTYIHEAGHLFGLGHQRGVYRDYGVGYKSDSLETVMRRQSFCAVPTEVSPKECSIQVPYFSSPSGMIDGKSFGSEDANSALVMQETVPIIASLYERLPTITRHPSSVRLIEGRTIRLESSAEGAGNLSYQWYKNDEPLDTERANSSVYQLNDASVADAGRYFVRVTNMHGYSDSLTANVAKIVFARQPRNKSIKFGKKFRLSAFAVSDEEVRYQWYKKEQDKFDLIPGATNRHYAVPSAGAKDKADYFVKASNSSGDFIDSKHIYVDVKRLPPSNVAIYADSLFVVDAKQCPGLPLRLAVLSGHYEPTYHYRWFKDGQFLGAQGRYWSYGVTNFSSDDAGIYQVEVTENFGSHVVLSDSFQVSVSEDIERCAELGDSLSPDYDLDP